MQKWIIPVMAQIFLIVVTGAVWTREPLPSDEYTIQFGGLVLNYDFVFPVCDVNYQLITHLDLCLSNRLQSLQYV